MAVMALLCLGLGLFPGKMAPLFAPVVQSLSFDILPVESAWTRLQIEAPQGINLASPAIALMLLLALFLMAAPLLINRGKKTRRPDNPWNCGTPHTPLVMQYTSAASSELIRYMFNYIPSWLTKVVPDYLPAHLHLSYSDANPQVVIELFRAAYNQVINWVLQGSKKIGRAVQKTDIRRPLTYIFWTNILILVLFLLFRGVTL